MKKIISIVALSLVGLLVVATIVMACVQYNSFSAVNKDAGIITVIRTSSQTSFDADDKEYDKIYSLIEKSRKENALSTLFQGAFGFEPEVDVKSNEQSMPTAVDGTYYIKFVYNEEQTLKINGKAYTTNTTTKETLTYTIMYLEVKNAKDFTEVNAYFGSNEAGTKYTYSVSMIAHQADLYSYINDIEIPGVTA